MIAVATAASMLVLVGKHRPVLRPAILALALLVAAPVEGRTPLQARVEAKLAEAGPGARFGLVVATEDGRELIAIAPEQRFIPASNTKIFTTAAAFAALPDLDRPDIVGGAAVRLERDDAGRDDVVIEGNGDARLSSAPDCVANCLAALADAVAERTRTVDDVIGDDRRFPDQRWSPGMSWNNIPTSSGTAVSALTLDNNELPMLVTPGAAGEPPKLALLPYYTIDNQAVTVAGDARGLQFDRLPGSFAVRLTGSIAEGARPALLRLAIDDPAHYAAWRLKALLEERGVKVTGAVSVRHRPPMPGDDPTARSGDGSPPPPRLPPLAKLTPPPLIEDIAVINKVSQNVHAELLLRRIGSISGSGSIADGTAVVRSMLERAGVPRPNHDFADGSGMSTYNRVAPRGVVTLLRWIDAQPWGAAWRATLPVAGIDGTLARRFRGTALDGRLFAKTGTLNATNALSGYMIARSGRTLLFSIFANDVPEGASANRMIDAALEMVAAEN